MKASIRVLAILHILACAGLALSQEAVLIPAGKVVIGDYPAGYGNRPAKIVTVPDFFIDKTAVTNEAFAKFIDDGGYAKMAYWVIDGAVDSLAGWRWKEAEAIRHPEFKIEIAGHTDSYGAERYNQWLSEKRAEAVAEFFASLGVREENMQVMGYGESRPLAPDTNEENRYLNRRVEISLIELREQIADK